MHYTELKAAWAELTAEGAAFEIVREPIRGVPTLCYKNAPPNVRALWLSTKAFAEREYLIYQDQRITYGQAHAQVDAIASWLAGQGVKSGDRVAIAMRNYPEWLLVYWACVCTGIAVVGMNAWWVGEEIDYAVDDSRPKVIFCDAERLAQIRARPAIRTPLVAVRAPDVPAGVTDFADVLAATAQLPDVEIDPDADACIFYTSGTTGFPKGAQLTHRGCVSNLFSMMFSGQVTALATARATGVAPDPDAPPPIPVALLTTPLFHVTANNCGAYAVTAAGGKLVLMYKWAAKEALVLIEREKVSSMSGVPVMSRELITHPDFGAHDLSSLVSLGGGGAQLPPDLVHKIDQSVATARPNTGYGMTETCGIITAVSADFFVDKPDSAGPAMPVFETKCVDDEGQAVARGEVGELWVSGAQVIKGYLNRPDATAETITEGWLHTGDIARVDADGFIFIVDRKKDMVLRGGENVYCAEVEAALYRHDAVAEVCVFGVPDERLGEEVAAAIVLREGMAATAADLREHCIAIMARHKAPRYVWILIEPLPRNASGKFLRRELRASLALSEAA
ncbi:MAG TPA: class I adenylate-forming enzyme family protein [Caulobacteraceae bacterium]|jgi:long-chain acyl-CoA synthetase|nr:class I adenylate-forming enzyme family protein [Caulobacteraceae bacterium]